MRDNGNMLLSELLSMAKRELGVGESKINARLFVKV
jgi:hypothetical protein